MTVKFKPRPRKTLKKATTTVSSVFRCLANLPDPAADATIIGDFILEKDAPCDLRDLILKGDCGQSALMSVQKLCETQGLGVPPNIGSVKELIRDALAALGSADVDKKSWVNPREAHAADKVELEKSLNASEGKLTNAESRI